MNLRTYPGKTQKDSSKNNLTEDLIKIPPLKRLTDVLFSIIVLLVLLPLSVILVLLIKIDGIFNNEDRGNIFYKEARISQGKPFNLIKFRLFKNKAIELIRSSVLTTKKVENNPDNLTYVGKYLKKWGLDEIPQFINILKGDMAIVGPRPKPPGEYEEEIKRSIYKRRILKAGITGPVQIMKGTARLEADEIAEDDRYVEKCRTYSQIKLFITDFKIMLKTLKVMFKGTGE